MISECDVEHWRLWISREEAATDIVTEALVHRFRATFNIYGESISSLPGLHWCLAPGLVSTDMLGNDGHPVGSDFLPTIPMARRMSAGGKLNIYTPFQIGDKVARRSEIADIVLKRVAQACYASLRSSTPIESRNIAYQ